MRDFTERKEEIFRRSQARIAQRKKTVRQLVVSCVPVVLCVCVMTGYLVLGGFGKSENAAPDAAGSDYNYGIVADAESPEMKPMAPGDLMAPADDASRADAVMLIVGDHCYTDGKTLSDFRQIACQLQLESSVAPEISGGSQYTGDGIIKGQNGDSDAYPVTVHYADGSVEHYTLRGNLLICSDGQVQLLLTDEQARWLQELWEGK